MNKILVGLDGSPLAETIVPFVEMLAKKTHAAVTLFHVVSLPAGTPSVADHPAVDSLVRGATQRAEAYLSEPCRRLANAGVETSVAIVAGDPVREIVRRAQEGGFDTIALATRGRTGVERWAHGSVADGVLHATTIPLLLMQPSEGWKATPREIRRVVVMTDGSAEAEIAIATAEPIAARLCVPLALLRFVEPIIPEFGFDPMSAAYVDVQAITNGAAEAARELLEKRAAELRTHGISGSSKVIVAPPVEGIAAYVREHPHTLVVLATHGRTGWRRALIGSVARGVVQTVAAPIIVCPLPQSVGSSREK